MLFHEEPQEVIFLHGIWRHIKEFGIEGQIPRIFSPVKLEKRGAYHLTENFGNSGWKVNGKVTFRKFQPKIEEYVLR